MTATLRNAYIYKTLHDFASISCVYPCRKRSVTSSNVPRTRRRMSPGMGFRPICAKTAAAPFLCRRAKQPPLVWLAFPRKRRYSRADESRNPCHVRRSDRCSTALWPVACAACEPWGLAMADLCREPAWRAGYGVAGGVVGARRWSRRSRLQGGDRRRGGKQELFLSERARGNVARRG